MRFVDDPRQWRERAEQARFTAEHTPDGAEKQRLLGLAEGYLRMARYAEERLTGSEA